MTSRQRVWIELEDGTRLCGRGFGALAATSGEVVFNTSMVGYVESLTDPSYRGQILLLTYPLVGNYVVPPADADRFESGAIQVRGLLVARAMHDTSHAGAARSLHDWLLAEGVPGVEGVDTRSLTLRLRERGTMLGRILPDGLDPADHPPLYDPNRGDVVREVSVTAPELHAPTEGSPRNGRTRRVVLVDCGAKRSLRRELQARGVEVLVVPYDHDYTGERFDGVLLSNGPGNPDYCRRTVEVLRRAMALGRPIFGVCLGSQLLGLAAGARTYKLRYGHRGQNQPCAEVGTTRCVLTSQNHGYALDEATIPEGWELWFRNANDGSVEGIRHARRPFAGVQFHPEAAPGPLDSRYLFDRFVESLG
jgi:carbamoyl-phosphate synthase small subunit